jgi:hypothetical protein
MHNIKDFGLTTNQLQVRYENRNAHPDYVRAVWRFEVQQCLTDQGYWDWVRTQLEQEQEELSQDSPY